MKKITFLLSGFLVNIFYCSAQSTGDYRSKQTGLWSAVASWETYNGTSWVAAATAPNSTNGIITIQSGHAITSNGAVTADQVKINNGGAFIISANTFTLNDGTGNDLDCDGSFELSGGTLTGGGLISFNANSAFEWSGGSFGGSGNININVGASADMSSSNHSLGDTRILNNYGTITWTGGAFYMAAGMPIFNNYGTFNIYTDADETTSGVTTPQFNNKLTGIINKLGSPTDETYFGGATVFKNEGTMNVNSSFLQMSCNMINTAAINLYFGAGLVLQYDTTNINAGSVITGEGSLICSGATVFINAGTVSMRNLNVSNGTLTSAVAFSFGTDQSLNISNGTFYSNAAVNLNSGSSFEWTGGGNAGTGSITISSGATVNMNTGTHYLADNKVINNYGTWNWTAGGFTFYSGTPTINNYGSFNINTDFDISSSATTAQFNNKSTGIINKIGSFGEETSFGYGVTFSNAGTININSALLQFFADVVNTGAININFGAEANFSDGITNLNTGTAVSGEGTIHFSGADATINAGAVNIKIMYVSAGTLTSNIALTLNTDQQIRLTNGILTAVSNINFNTGSTFNWEGGTSGGAGMMNINAGAVLNMNTGYHYLADTKVLNNYGLWQWDAGAFIFLNGAAIVNNYNTWNIDTDTDISSSGGTGTINNKSTGIITKNGIGGQQTTVSAIDAVTNEGTINISSGMLRFYTGMTNTGNINADYGADINFTAGDVAINTGTTVAGGGTINFDGATAMINAGTFTIKHIVVSNGSATLSIPLNIATDNDLSLSNGTLDGTGNITFNNGSSFLWAGGINGGSGIITINNGAGCLMSGSTHFLAESKTINNYGNWDWTAGGFTFYNGTALVNNYGNFNISTDNEISSAAGTGPFNNKASGIITKTGSSSDATLISGIDSFNNEGTVHIASGALQLNVNGVHSGIYDLSFGATLKGNITMSFTGPTFNNNGFVTLPAIAFDAASIQYLDGIGSINTLTVNNTIGVMQTGEQNIVTQINIHPNSRLTVYHDLNVN